LVKTQVQSSIDIERLETAVTALRLLRILVLYFCQCTTITEQQNPFKVIILLRTWLYRAFFKAQSNNEARE
jgi:hypothetical protein